MASLIAPERRAHYEQLQTKKCRADKINQSCFLLTCGIALEAVLVLFVGIGSEHSRDLIYAVFLSLSVIAALIGCIRRNLILSIIACILYLAGYIITKQYEDAFVLMGLCLHLIPCGGAVYANYQEHQLRQEEGYPQFDFMPEEQALQTEFAQQTSYAMLNKQKNAVPAQPAEQPAAPPHDMDYI